MGHWVFWEWVAYASLWVAAIIVAIDGGLRMAPDVRAHLPSFFSFLERPWVAFLPLVFLMTGTFVLLGHELGFYEESHSAPLHAATPDAATPPKVDDNAAILTRIAVLDDRYRSVENFVQGFQNSCAVQLEQVARAYNHATMAMFDEMAKAAENFVNLAMGESVSLRSHPTYDRLPDKPAPGEPSNPPTIVADYRKLYDQCETAKLTTQLIEQRYEQKRRAYANDLKR